MVLDCVWGCVRACIRTCIHTYTHTHTHTHIRGNPGGLLSSAVGVAEAFLPQGTTIVETRGRAAAEASATSGPTNIAVRDSKLPAQPAALLSSAEDAREPSGADWRYTTTRPPIIDPSVRVVVLTDARCALSVYMACSLHTPGAPCVLSINMPCCTDVHSAYLRLT